MGFYFRKSVRVGPLRFNLSKSGVGVSAGIKGLRVGVGPRGNYIHAGAGGFYYRTTLTPKETRNLNQPHSDRDELPIAVDHEPMTKIDSNLNLLFKDSSEDKLVCEINQKLKMIYFWKWSLGATFLLAYYFGFQALLAGLAVTCGVYLWDETRKSVVLFFDFDDSERTKYESIVNSFDQVLNTKKIWHVEAEAKIKDWKRNSGAGAVVSKKDTKVSQSPVKMLKTNIPIPTIGVGEQMLCFLPNKLLVLGKETAATVEYNNLTIESSSIRFIEHRSVPSDAEIIDHTYLYVNKSGGPDKRFKNNRRIPICKYEEVNFSSSTGLNEQLQLSKCGQFEQFKAALSKLRRAA